MSGDKKNLRRISLVVTAQTKYHLDHLAAAAGHNSPGRVVDKLVREKMLTFQGSGRVYAKK